MRFRQSVSDNLGIRALQWLMFAAFVAFGFGWMGPGQELSKISRLSDSSHSADAVITSLRPGDFMNAPSVNYSYDVDGKHFGEFARIQADQVTRLAPGDHIKAIYASGDPSQSAVDLEAERQSATKGIKIVLVLEAIVALFFWGPLLFGYLASGSIDLPTGNLFAGFVILLIMLTAGLCMLFFGALPQYNRASDLIQTGKPITAQVTLVYDDDKSRVADYAYTIDGRHYSGKMPYHGGYGDRPTVHVTYLPSDPGYSALDPRAARSNAQGAILFMLLWNGLVGIAFFFVTKQAFSR